MTVPTPTHTPIETSTFLDSRPLKSPHTFFLASFLAAISALLASFSAAAALAADLAAADGAAAAGAAIPISHYSKVNFRSVT